MPLPDRPRLGPDPTQLLLYNAFRALGHLRIDPRLLGRHELEAIQRAAIEALTWTTQELARRVDVRQ